MQTRQFLTRGYERAVSCFVPLWTLGVVLQTGGGCRGDLWIFGSGYVTVWVVMWCVLCSTPAANAEGCLADCFVNSVQMGTVTPWAATTKERLWLRYLQPKKYVRLLTLKTLKLIPDEYFQHLMLFFISHYRFLAHPYMYFNFSGPVVLYVGSGVIWVLTILNLLIDFDPLRSQLKTSHTLISL